MSGFEAYYLRAHYRPPPSPPSLPPPWPPGQAPLSPPHVPQDTGIGDDLAPHGGFEIWYSDVSAFFGTKARTVLRGQQDRISTYAIDRDERGDCGPAGTSRCASTTRTSGCASRRCRSLAAPGRFGAGSLRRRKRTASRPASPTPSPSPRRRPRRSRSPPPLSGGGGGGRRPARVVAPPPPRPGARRAVHAQRAAGRARAQPGRQRGRGHRDGLAARPRRPPVAGAGPAPCARGGVPLPRRAARRGLHARRQHDQPVPAQRGRQRLDDVHPVRRHGVGDAAALGRDRAARARRDARPARVRLARAVRRERLRALRRLGLLPGPRCNAVLRGVEAGLGVAKGARKSRAVPECVRSAACVAEVAEEVVAAARSRRCRSRRASRRWRRPTARCSTARAPSLRTRARPWADEAARQALLRAHREAVDAAAARDAQTPARDVIAVVNPALLRARLGGPAAGRGARRARRPRARSTASAAAPGDAGADQHHVSRAGGQERWRRTRRIEATRLWMRMGVAATTPRAGPRLHGLAVPRRDDRVPPALCDAARTLVALRAEAETPPDPKEVREERKRRLKEHAREAGRGVLRALPRRARRVRRALLRDPHARRAEARRGRGAAHDRGAAPEGRGALWRGRAGGHRHAQPGPAPRRGVPQPAGERDDRRRRRRARGRHGWRRVHGPLAAAPPERQARAELRRRQEQARRDGHQPGRGPAQGGAHARHGARAHEHGRRGAPQRL